ncbi:MAG TPA: hypothetical protein VFW19_01235 [Allosphingosinicella sp.]|nr:hypothetical protein [Allosphingosinicella sp.]
MSDDDGLCGFGEPAAAAPAAPEPIGMVDGRSVAGFWMPAWASRSYPMPERRIAERGRRG